MSSLKVIQSTPQPEPHSKIKKIIAVAAGKGGVGKSSVAVHLAHSLRKKNYRVGLLDSDIYGPSLQQMLPESTPPMENPNNPEKLLPALSFGMSVISVAHFKKEASIVRAPIANQIIDQFLNIVDWGELDFLIIDFPPGTGDIQLTLMQKARLSCAIVVTTPQVVATLDVRKAMQLFQKMKIPLLGVIENMSYFLEETGRKLTPFGSGGGRALASEFSIPFIGEIPLDPLISEAGDSGRCFIDEKPDSLPSKVFELICNEVLQQMTYLPKEELEIIQSGPFHLEMKLEEGSFRIPLHEIQKRCSCARCEKEKKCDENVSLLEFSPVGRYAIKIKFSSGCSLGIYSYELLKNLAIMQHEIFKV